MFSRRDMQVPKTSNQQIAHIIMFEVLMIACRDKIPDVLAENGFC